MKKQYFFALITLVMAVGNGSAQVAKQAPLSPKHPLAGVWRIDLPTKCFEEYEFRPNGTRLSRSGEERNESSFEISEVDSANGLYRWTDKINRVNGKPDCGGHVTPLGDTAVNFIRIKAGANKFMLCGDENLKSCYAEFYRK